MFSPGTDTHTTDKWSQLFWGLRGPDDIVHRRVSDNDDSDYTDSTDRKDWFVTDARGSVRAILAAASPHALVQERVVYQSYGSQPDHTFEDLIEPGHPLRPIKRMLDAALSGMSRGRPPATRAGRGVIADLPTAALAGSGRSSYIDKSGDARLRCQHGGQR